MPESAAQDETGNGGEDQEGGADGAGGYGHEEGPHPGNDWSDVAGEAIDQAESGEDTGLLDGSSALEDAVGHEQDREDRDVKSQEAPWRPYNPGLDEVVIVQPSRQGRDHDDEVARLLIKDVTRESAWLRARLRSVVRSLEMTSTYHGTPKGRRLSSRYFVDSHAALRNGEVPNKAYSVKSTKVPRAPGGSPRVRRVVHLEYSINWRWDFSPFPASNPGSPPRHSRFEARPFGWIS